MVFSLIIAATLVMAAPLSAQHGGGSAKPKPAQAPKVQSPKVQAPKPVKVQSAPKSTTAKTTKAPNTAKATKAPKATKTTKTTTPTTTLTPVQQKLQRNTNLASKLQSRLPAGTNLMLASEGFRNLGQFVAAVNVSNNLGIPFAELKTRMVDRGMSLGQAIQDARPATTDTTTVVVRAEREADEMIEGTKATKTTKPTKATKPTKTKDAKVRDGER
jgi:hypothetical protein